MTRLGKTKLAFTLIEILLVVVLVTIVSAIIFSIIRPTKVFNNVAAREMISNQQELESAINQYYVDNLSWPAGLDASLRAIGTDTSGCDQVMTYPQSAQETAVNSCINISSDLVPNYIVSVPVLNSFNSNYTGIGVKIVNDRLQIWLDDQAISAVGGSVGNYTSNSVTSTANQSPVASALAINGVLTTETLLTATYIYDDTESDVESGTAIVWEIADDAVGLNSIIVSTANSYTAPVSRAGKFLRLSVTPSAATGSSPGATSVTNWLGPLPPKPYVSNSGLTVIKSTAQSPVSGTGPFAGTTWQLTSGSDGANQYHKAGPNIGGNTQDTLQGPRFDYPINFQLTGQYKVFVRMRGSSGVDDSVHVSLDNQPLTFGRYGLSRGNWGWASSVVGEVRFTIASPGVRTVSVWMREDGTEYDCVVVKHIPTQGTNNPPNSACPTQTGK